MSKGSNTTRTGGSSSTRAAQVNGGSSVSAAPSRQSSNANINNGLKLGDINNSIKERTGKTFSNRDIQYITLHATSKDGREMTVELEKKAILRKKTANLFLGGFSGGSIEFGTLSNKDRGFEKAIDTSKPVTMRFADLGNRDAKYSLNVQTGKVTRLGTMSQSEKMAWHRAEFKK